MNIGSWRPEAGYITLLTWILKHFKMKINRVIQNKEVYKEIMLHNKANTITCTSTLTKWPLEKT